jgi:hypothetical protein
MMLTRIEPDQPGFDRRHFDCPLCCESQSFVIAIEVYKPA